MVAKRCTGCGRTVEVAEDARSFRCSACGETTWDAARLRALYALYADDVVVSRVARCSADDAQLSHPWDLEREEENKAFAVLAAELRALHARAIQARSAFNRPARARLLDARAAVVGLVDPARAWRALVESGLMPATWLDDPQRRFFADMGVLQAHPEDVDACVAFASDVDGVLAAERAFHAFAASIGLPEAPVLWDGVLVGHDALLRYAPCVREALKRAVGGYVATVDRDIDAALLGDALFGAWGWLSPFRPLLDLYATGYAIEASPDDDGVEELVLVAPPFVPS